MKKLLLCLPLVIAVAMMGCAGGGIDTKDLRLGMTTQEARSVLGDPVCTYSSPVGSSVAQVWDYAKDTTGIPNPLDDYGWIFPPTTHVVRLWFVNGKLGEWQSGKFSSLESLEKLESESRWHMPPNFKSQTGPQCILKAWQSGQSPQ